MTRAALLVLALAVAVPAQAREVEAICAPLVAPHAGVALVVGVVHEGGQHVQPFGAASRSQPTLFEIGSVSKVFTGALLSALARAGKVQLDEPVRSLLPEGVTVPAHAGREITLLDLATHRSALPRLPGNMRPRNPRNPYADYTVEQLHAFLGGYELPRDVGATYEYSNLGVGLLGHALALRAGGTYEAVLVERICAPLGLDDTRITLAAGQRARLAPGHAANGKPVANWDIPTLAGAGGLRSTVPDLLRFAAATLGLGQPPAELHAALRDAHAVRFTHGGQRVGLCWHVFDLPGVGSIAAHNGRTGGYESFLALCPERRLGVVLLCSMIRPLDEAGGALLRLAAKEAARGRGNF